jgi:hypothetical protein
MSTKHNTKHKATTKKLGSTAALPMSPFVLAVAVLTRTPAVFVAVAVCC